MLQNLFGKNGSHFLSFYVIAKQELNYPEAISSIMVKLEIANVILFTIDMKKFTLALVKSKKISIDVGYLNGTFRIKWQKMFAISNFAIIGKIISLGSFRTRLLLEMNVTKVLSIFH